MNNAAVYRPDDVNFIEKMFEGTFCDIWKVKVTSGSKKKSTVAKCMRGKLVFSAYINRLHFLKYKEVIQVS